MCYQNEINEIFMVIAAALGTAQKTAEEMREEVAEEAEKLKKRSKIFVYNVPESSDHFT